MSHRRGTDRAAATALVLDDDGAKQPPHFFGPIARHRVHHAARRIRNNQADRRLRIFRLSPRLRSRKKAGAKSRRSETNTITTIHSRFPPEFFAWLMPLARLPGLCNVHNPPAEL